MALLIGTDEAGYGPNLGPLVISATAWRVAEDDLRRDLYETLGECVCAETANRRDPRIAIADSKKLYQPGGGLASFERGVLAALRMLDLAPLRWREIWAALDPTCAQDVEKTPWHAGYDADLPCAITPAALAEAAATLAAGLHQAGVTLAAARSLVVFPEAFNDLLDRHESKGALLSHGALGLVRELLALSDDEPALVVCDKHGGRNRYAPLLQHFFPDPLVETHQESRATSIYRWGPESRRVEVRFVTQGESFLPSALASMISKYLRELAMAAFNEFWRRRLPELRPTAGYPVDARRFQAEIAPVQLKLGITDRQLWRNR